MQSPTSRRDTPNISLGERRGKSDLARFSLDLSWARAATDSARLRAYPSPPMSGSPPLPPRRNPDFSDRGHGGYVSSGQEVFRGPQQPQLEQSEHGGQQYRTYPQDQMSLPSYAPVRMDMPPGQMQYQQPHQIPPQMIPQQQHVRYPGPHTQHPQHQQIPAPFPTPERGESSDFTSPKQQRKTKGHVASACVPCKRAHLRCDAQRPCSRCMSNGKEDSCIDVQHKKRGRPRLRDEREPRYDTLGTPYAPPDTMRRPMPEYSQPSHSMNAPFGDPLHRSGSYRVLKSQGGGHMGGPIAPRLVDQQMLAETTAYGGPPMQPAPRMSATQEPVCAHLNMDLQFAKATQSFLDTLGHPAITSRILQDIVVPNDVEKVNRLLRAFEEERRQREPNYLPPIYLKLEEDRVIQGVGFGPDEMGQVRTDKQEMLTFQGADGQQRSFQVRMGLAKKDSTYFVVLLLTIPNVGFQPAQSPYSREGYVRETQYGYQNPPQGYMHNPSMYAPQQYDPNLQPFRQPGQLGSNVPPTANMPVFSQSQQRQEFVPSQPSYQTPRSELPQGQVQAAPRQRDFQLPPIREAPMQRRDERSGRVDIGGLIDNPNPSQKGA